ncbi:cysteine desulfurase / selenocysteine lyase [Reichenbachiella agariperforans]|uniref:Cysteine desulfurase n=1 Tax=Reichenbachiella agariperforans TaxID=156994 RepID=A0A1M6QKP3_REIAG|nr:cysteine desulfurase [Reichenbachiella agariperforans]SHK20822.1 cysteine desulfurase / selenocysteine lyase [Reichenbachiella agariperforans]
MVETQLNIEKIRKDFPILHQEVNGKPLVYFDNAATSQKPQCVIDALTHYYNTDNANIHRGIHTLAERSTTAFENTRKTVGKFLNAAEAEEIIFTKGTTEGINLVAATFGRKFIGEGDEIIISALEHHSNIVPWQILCEEKKCVLKVIPVNEKGELVLAEYDKLLSERTKLVSVNYISNALGTINPVQEIIDKAHAVGAKVLIDAAQATPHARVDVQAMGCDFLAFSAHKVYGPTGVGALYGKRALLEAMPPYQGGGEMIKDVSFSGTTYNDIPYKFEAGTPNIGEVIAFKAALDYVNEIGLENIAAYEHELLEYANELLADVEGFRPIGTADQKASVVSFLIDGVHPFDLGQILDAKGIAVRTGHHCAQPLMEIFNIEGTVRASFSVYNTKEEIKYFVEALKSSIKMFKK